MSEVIIYNFESERYEKIDNFQGILFHHIPKTAGSTFRAILENMFLEDEVCRAEIPGELAAINAKEIAKFKLFAGHFSFQICDDILKDRVWITFLRNPIDRVVSYYYNLIDPDRMPDTWKVRFENRNDWKEFLDFIRNATLKEFLSSVNKKANKIVCNRQTQAFIPDNVRTNVEDWGAYNENLIALAKLSLKKKFAFVGIQEYFDLSLDLFSSTFAINSIDSSNYTTNINTNKNKHTKYFLDDAIVEVIKEKNRMDFELYEYAKDLFFERLHKINKKILWHNRVQNFETKISEEFSKNHCFGIDDVYSTHGFYVVEHALNKSFKWSGYQTPSIIEFVYKFEKSRAYKLEIKLANIIDESILPSVKICLNDSVLMHNLKKKWFNRKHNAIVSEISSCNIDYYKTIHSLKIFSDLKKEGLHKGARSLGLAISHIEVKEL